MTDPNHEARNRDGVLLCPFQGEMTPMILLDETVFEAADEIHLDRKPNLTPR